MFKFISGLLLIGFVVGFNATNTTHLHYNNASLVQPEINSRNFHLKGVALGGWLVLEPYITPSLFLSFNATNGTEADISLDEYHFCQTLGHQEAQRRLQRHWDTFYNESDFAKIKHLGLNMVRIPIGYWAFETLSHDPYVQGAQAYLDKALDWAQNHDLKVWIDLHGVPGSQNGFDNSGFRDIGYPGWFNRTEHIQLSYKVLQQIYTKYGSKKYQDTVIAIEVVNEPLTANISISNITAFYENTYQDARIYQEVNNTIVFHDAFQPTGYYNHRFSYSNTSDSHKYYNILIDHHHYEVFDAGALNLTIGQHLDSIKGYASGIAKELKYHPAVVGEWLAALTDCAPWLNGVGLGSRYEGQAPYLNPRIAACGNINDFSLWSSDKRKGYRKFIEMQLDQYESQTSGWIFWCFKTETTIEWDLNRLVDLNLFPQPLDQRLYIVNGTDTDKEAEKDDSYRINGGNAVTMSFGLIVSGLVFAICW